MLLTTVLGAGNLQLMMEICPYSHGASGLEKDPTTMHCGEVGYNREPPGLQKVQTKQKLCTKQLWEWKKEESERIPDNVATKVKKSVRIGHARVGREIFMSCVYL